MAFRSASKTSSTSPDCRRPAGRSAGRIESPKRTPTSSPISARPAPSSWVKRSRRPMPGSIRRSLAIPGILSERRAAPRAARPPRWPAACASARSAVRPAARSPGPASFCGVAGMKPTQVFAQRTGCFLAGPSLDHVGPIARTVEDLRAHAIGLCCESAAHESGRCAMLARSDETVRFDSVRLRGFFDRRASSAVASAFDEATALSPPREQKSCRIDDPVDFDQILVQHRDRDGSGGGSYPLPMDRRIARAIILLASVSSSPKVAAVWRVTISPPRPE